MWLIYTMQYYLGIKNEDIMSFAGIWMKLGERERKRESGKNKVFINSGQEMAKDGEKQDF
mgnify:CR=1 FL=1